MLVPHTINLTVITSQGKSCQLTVESTAGTHFVKRRAVEALCASGFNGEEQQAVKKALYFKLICPSSLKTLRDDATLFDEQIIKDCELLLVKKRLDESLFSRYGAAAASRDKTVTKSPDAARIREATAKLTKKGTVQKQRDSVSPEVFQKDLKRILVTLVESAQNVLALNAEAAKIFKEAQEIMSQESSTATAGPNIPDETLSQLTDMGFSREMAVAALNRSRVQRIDGRQPDSKYTRGMSVHAAMEWLLQHPDGVPTTTTEAEEGAASLTVPLSTSGQPSEKSLTSLAASTAKSSSADVRPKTGSASLDTQCPAHSSRKTSKAQTILESFRAYKRRKFKPNLIALNSLIDMGFEESDVLEALRINDNNQEGACEWLLGDRSCENSLDGLEEGIEPSSPLYQAIITNPVVQLGLSNPRCLLAFLHMLENGANTMDWLKDPDVGPILLQISRIYTAERSDCVFPGFGHD